MRIKVRTGNKRLSAALDRVNGDARRRFAIRAVAVIRLAGEAERRLKESGVPKRMRKGTRLTVVPRGPSSRQDGGDVDSTLVVLERGASSWFLVEARRIAISPMSEGVMQYTVSQELYDTVTRHATRDMVVAGSGTCGDGASGEAPVSEVAENPDRGRSGRESDYVCATLE